MMTLFYSYIILDEDYYIKSIFGFSKDVQSYILLLIRMFELIDNEKIAIFPGKVSMMIII